MSIPRIKLPILIFLHLFVIIATQSVHSQSFRGLVGPQNGTFNIGEVTSYYVYDENSIPWSVLEWSIEYFGDSTIYPLPNNNSGFIDHIWDRVGSGQILVQYNHPTAGNITEYIGFTVTGPFNPGKIGIGSTPNVYYEDTGICNGNTLFLSSEIPASGGDSSSGNYIYIWQYSFDSFASSIETLGSGTEFEEMFFDPFNLVNNLPNPPNEIWFRRGVALNPTNDINDYTFANEEPHLWLLETPNTPTGNNVTLTSSGNATLQVSSNFSNFYWYDSETDTSPETSGTTYDVFINSTTTLYVSAYVNVFSDDGTEVICESDRHPITITVSSGNNNCNVPQSEKDALIALYEATNGDQWTNTLVNNQPWDVDGSLGIPVCDWYGVSIENNHVTQLALPRNNLNGILPNELGNLSNLFYFSLNHNSLIGELPPTITSQPGSYIDLDDNNLSGEIPDTFTSIHYLDLSNNSLSGEIPNTLDVSTYLDLSFNNLSGEIPQNLETVGGALLLQGNNLFGSIPSSFIPGGFSININKFIFKDLEVNHVNFQNSINDYTYSPQAKVDQEETLSIGEDCSITLTSNQLTSTNNSYQWYKNDIAIPGAINKDYVITNSSADDAGIYHFTATNSIVTGLTLERHPITINYTGGPCGETLPLIQYCYYNYQISLPPPGIPAQPGTITYYDEYGNEQVINNIFNEDGNVVVMSSSVPIVNESMIPCWSTNTFCTSDIEVITTVNLTPSGSNILWYTSETDIEPIASDFDFVEETELGGVTYWWDDTSDSNATRTSAVIYIDESTPSGETYQEFSIGATVAMLQASGASINWYSSANGGTPLDTNTILIDGEIYYAEDAGISACRLAVEVFVGTIPPKGDGVQYVCSGSVINDIVLDPIPEGNEIIWYLTETGGSPVSSTETTLTEGTTYYAAQIDANEVESVERKGVTVFMYNVRPPLLPSNTQDFYSNEQRTVGDLKVIGNNVEWYSQEVGGTKYLESSQVVDGTYYAQQTDGDCISERVGLTVKILDEELPTIVACEKFKPQVGGHYVISGWVREQEAEVSATETKDFTEVNDLFVNLLNHLKDRFLSEDKYDLDIPNIYVPISDTDIVNFDGLVPYVIGQPAGEHKLTVYNFSRINDDYGRAIGFQFSLTSEDDNRVFKYETPKIEIYSCNTCFNRVSSTKNHPLLGRARDILNFNSSQFVNGTLTVSQTFIPHETATVPNPNPQITVATPILSESIIYSDFIETPNSELDVMSYENAAIELTYIENETGALMTNERKSFYPQGAIIDGWQRIIGEFTIPLHAKTLNINLKNSGNNEEDNVNIYFDDIRVQPFDSNMKTFVYHPVNQRLMSELDENNYATFYEYDLEGGLVRVKKETEKGIYTIQETRSGNKKATN